MAAVALTVAIVTVPLRLFQPRSTRLARFGQPASTAHVEVQVHLEDGERARAIERSCRSALKRAARTWAPFPLPLDRIEVISSAPPLGKADIFEEWVTAPEGAGTDSLVVVSIGTAMDGRNLTADEIAGALAGQIERLVVDRYQREHPKAQPAVSVGEAGREPATIQPVRSVGAPANDTTFGPDNVTDLGSVRALLADIKKSQPLVPAGSSMNGVDLEPDPAS
jgi:hypothetical protein